MTSAPTRSAAPRSGPPSWVNRLVLRVLRSRRWSPEVGGTLVGLRYTARNGRTVTLPVQAAVDGNRVTILVGNAATKSWWRHFRAGAPVDVLIRGRWHPGRARAVVDDSGAGAAAYRRWFPHAGTDANPTVVTVDLTDAPSTPPLRGRRLMWAWFVRVTAAEFAGFAVPAVVGTLTAYAAAVVAVPAVLAAGAIEGAMLGWGQATVLRRALPAVAGRRWIVATATAAVVAYAIGLTPSTFATSVESWPPTVLALAGLLLGAGLLASIGTAQWLLLRRHIARAYRWILTTAVAWLLGLGVFLGFAMPLWQPGQPVALIVAIGVAGGLLMAATTSLVTALALRSLLRQPLASRPDGPTSGSLRPPVG